VSDLPDKLRFLASGQEDIHSVMLSEAADRIEALEAELADVQEWSGAVAFVTTVQNVVDADGPPWGDEFLAWYKPDQWFGEHRACAVFIGEKMKAAKGE
jgi:hypothetical protein